MEDSGEEEFQTIIPHINCQAQKVSCEPITSSTARPSSARVLTERCQSSSHLPGGNTDIYSVSFHSGCIMVLKCEKKKRKKENTRGPDRPAIIYIYYTRPHLVADRVVGVLMKRDFKSIIENWYSIVVFCWKDKVLYFSFEAILTCLLETSWELLLISSHLICSLIVLWHRWLYSALCNEVHLRPLKPDHSCLQILFWFIKAVNWHL